jgi:ubiquinone/menaquinone biosynthesis C-methylase UbiE
MDDYSESTYGERIAKFYDEWYSEYEPSAIGFLSELAGDGKALELGIGTGRIALPLLKAGVKVQGLDASEAMVARLHAKPGGEGISVTMGNFLNVNVEGRFRLIYIVFNTFFGLLTQDDQITCFQNVSRHLEPNGAFAVEAFVPNMGYYTDGQSMRVVSLGENEMQVDASQLEMDKQLITSQHVQLTPQGTFFFPVKLRYIWPSEMDLMARLASDSANWVSSIATTMAAGAWAI